MTAVDRRAVEMGFNNREFESGVGGTLKTLDALKKGLNLESSVKSLSGLSAAGRNFSLGNISDSLRGMSDRFSTLGIIGITVLQNLTNAALDLGKKLFTAALGLDSMKAGFGSFETKINATKTVMSGTGETIDQVNRSLDDLNKYSDRTIYSFEDMTANISKFTNAGLSSKKAAIAIQGISNVAALSGANTGEAARAMYNFGQALSQGSVRLMDWKSIENANMATIEFKTQLLETAVAMGTLKKQTDGTYKTINGNEVLTATKNFNTSLEKQWLTTEVLVGTLDDYASMQTEIGKKANEAATQLKTYTALVDNIKDSLKTGWTKSWEHIFGNLDQATELFTYLGDKINGVLGDSARARNQLLSGWAAFGGRASLFAALKNTVEGVLNVMNLVKTAFSQVFPPKTAYELASFTYALKTLTDKFVITKDMAEDIKRVFRGFFAIFDIGIEGIKVLVGWLGKLVGASNLSGKGFLKQAGDIGNWIFELRNAIKYQGLLGKTFTDIKTKIEPLIQKFREFLINITPVVDKIKEFVQRIQDSFSGLEVDTSGIDSFMERIQVRFAPLTKLAEIVGRIATGIWGLLKHLVPIFSSIGQFVGDALGEIGNAIAISLKEMNFNAVYDVINEGLIAVVLLSIKKFFTEGASTFSGISGGVTSLLDGVKGSLVAWQSSLKAKTLLTIATAIGILALSLIALSLIDSAKLTVAIGAITVMFTELVGSMALFDKIPGGSTGGATKMAIQLLAISGAILLLSTAMTIISKIDPEKLVQGLLGIGAILAELAIFMTITNLSGSGAVKSAGLISLGIALNILALAVRQFANMDPAKLTQGLMAMGAILAELALFIKLSGNPKGIISTAIGLTILANAMVIFSFALSKLADMSWEELGRGLAAMAASLAIVTVAMRLMPKNMLVIGVGLLAVSTALVILSKALKSMGGMSWEEIGKGLGVLAGSLVILSVGMYAMTGALPGAFAMLVMAGALLMFVPALKALGSMELEELARGLLTIVAVFAIFALGGLILGPLVPVLLSLSAALFLFGIGTAAVGAGMLAFSAGLAALAISGTAGVTALVAIIAILLGLIPLIVTKIVEGILQFVTLIAESVSVIANALGILLTALIQVIIDVAPKFFEALKVILLGLIDVIVSVVPELSVAILFLITSLLDNLANSVPQWIESGLELLKALLDGIADGVTLVVEGAFDIIIAFLDAIGKKLPELVDAGWEMIISVVDGIADGVEKNLPELGRAAGRLANAIIDGLIGGIKAGVQGVIDAAANLGKEALAAIGIQIDANSPSEEFAKRGLWIAQGLANGINEYSKLVYDAAKNLGDDALGGLANIMAEINNSVNDNLDINPTIRPVLDLSEIVSGNKQISGIFGRSSLNVSRIADGIISIKPPKVESSQILSNSPKAVQPSAIAFNQYNYSPEALSRFEIYRQTRNLLNLKKGLVPN